MIYEPKCLNWSLGFVRRDAEIRCDMYSQGVLTVQQDFDNLKKLFFLNSRPFEERKSF